MGKIGSIGQVHTSTQGLTNNPNLYDGIEWRQSREPDHKVFLFNVSARKLKFDRFGKGMDIPGVDENDVATVAQGGPPAYSLKPSAFMKELATKVDLETGKPKTVIAGKENEKWHYVTSFPQPMIFPKFNDLSGVVETYEQDAVRYVVDLINPDNLGKSLANGTVNVSQGVDLSRSGVFFSLSNPPFQSDVREAIDRMEKYYKELLEKADTLALTDKAQLAQQLGSNPDYAYAADYFGKEVSWRREPVRTSECSACGGKKPSGRKFHMAEFGLCVEPSIEGWKAAVGAGVKRYDDVPEEFVWRKAEKAPAAK